MLVISREACLGSGDVLRRLSTPSEVTVEGKKEKEGEAEDGKEWLSWPIAPNLLAAPVLGED